MAEIKPFRGIRYDHRRFDQDELQRLVAPPYDVIDEAEQDALYERHRYNVVRLDLNRPTEADDAENNRYTRSRRHLMDWLATGVLRFDERPALYVHYQDFEDEAGNTYTRRGFISLVRLATYDEGVVLPHERTLKGPKVDRLELMKATECNLSQVFFLYDDPDSAVDTLLEGAFVRDEGIEITTEDGIRHRLWPVFAEDVHGKVAEALQDKALLIADGHHRYETALAYREFRRDVAEEPHPDAPYEYAMAFLVNLHDPGLQVFPTHRVVHSVDDFDLDTLRRRLTESGVFEIQELDPALTDDPKALQERLGEAGESRPSFVCLAPRLKTPWLVQFTGDAEADIFDEETPKEVRELDVAILHEGVFDRMLGISKAAQEAKTNLKYIKGLEPALEAAREADHQLVVLMNPTPVEQVDRVCRSGGKMPQKSTFFYPKILSGLVINPL